MRLLPFNIALLLLALPTASQAETKHTPAPVSAQLTENNQWGHSKIVRGKGLKGYVAFTFDDGPNPQTTPRVMATLSQFEVPATFFVVGRHFAGQNQENQEGVQILKTMAEQGFSIGNHTSSHKNLSKQPTELGKKHIGKNAKDLEKILGYQPRLFRPPFGVTTTQIRSYLARRGDTIVLWNIDPQDFRASSSSRGVARLRSSVLQKIYAKSGGIIVMHDTKEATVSALPGILRDLRAANCKRLKTGQTPILPVSLSVFMRYRDGRNNPRYELDREAIHKSRHQLWQHCNLSI